jgi:hypothetical protein
MDLNNYDTLDLINSLEAEAAKSLSELKTVQKDMDKALGRIRFILAVIHILKERTIQR